MAPAAGVVAAATRVVQLRAATLSGVEPNAVDAERATELLGLDAAGENRVQRLFAEADELRYSGGANGAKSLSPDARREVLELIEGLAK